MADLQSLIDVWERKAWGACGVDAALKLADSFTEACRDGEPIPQWALALRAMAARIRLHKTDPRRP